MELKMDSTQIKELLKQHLRIKIDHENQRVKILLLYDNDVISTDFIDYTEVVRVVERLNTGAYQ